MYRRHPTIDTKDNIFINLKFDTKKTIYILKTSIKFSVVSGGGQNLERPNLERPIFRKLKIVNIKRNQRSNDFFIFAI